MVDDTDKVLISLGVLVGGAIISVIIAKLVDVCYDRASISDDASDVSEHTRNLIRARLTVMKFRNKSLHKDVKAPIETESEKQENAVKVFRIWSAKSRVRAHPDQPNTENGQNDEDNIRVEDVFGGSGDEESTVEMETGPKAEVQETEKVVTVDETAVSAAVVDTKRPKSALKKPRPSGATTDTSGGNVGAEGMRPKSAVKRVTIAEPEASRSGSKETKNEPQSREKNNTPPLLSDQSSVADGTSATRVENGSVTPSSQEDTRTGQDIKGGGNNGKEVGVVEAWNEGKGAQSSPGRTPPRGKSNWRNTYVLYRGHSDDLLVPFKTKSKSKTKVKPKAKK